MERPFMNLIYPVIHFFNYETSKLEGNMKIVMPIKEFTRTLYFEVFLKFKANTHSFLLSNCSIMFM